MAEPSGAAHRVDAVVRGAIERLLREAGRPLTTVGDGDRLADLGIGSLDLVDLVAGLNTALMMDPFGQTLAFTDLQTVGDLCRAYRPRGQAPERSSAAELDHSRQRALARRAARRA